MEDLGSLCMGCMKKKPTRGVCPYCHYDLEQEQTSLYHLQPKTILNGKYMVGKVLGEGGFGITYIGWNLNLEIPIAIKEYFPTGFVTRDAKKADGVSVFSGNKGEFYEKGRESFLDEARRLAKFNKREGIVSVNDFFKENGTAYIVMEYLEGEDFGSYLRKNGGRLPAGTVFEMMKPMMEDLIAVHKEGLIHRDISPDNIRITTDSKVKLLDFGAAREVGGQKSLSVVLKPGYAPEEQYRTKGNQGPWTDVYGLCATMYRAITGQKPIESLDRINKDELLKPSELGISIQPSQERALMKGMAVFAQNRWQSVQELYNAIFSNQPTYDFYEEATMAGIGPRSGNNEAVTMTGIGPQSGNVSYSIPPTYGGGNRGNFGNQEIVTSISSSGGGKNPIQIVIIVLLSSLIGLLCFGGGMMVTKMITETKDSAQGKEESQEKEKKEEVATEATTETATEAMTETPATVAPATVATAAPVTAAPTTAPAATSNVYILPESNSRYLSYSDIQNLTSAQIKLAKNEIYARHGRKFNNSSIQAYFDNQSWYYGSVSPDNDSYIESLFNDYEKENVKFLKKYE